MSSAARCRQLLAQLEEHDERRPAAEVSIAAASAHHNTPRRINCGASAVITELGVHDAVPTAKSISSVTRAAAPHEADAAHARPLSLSNEQLRSAIDITQDVLAALALESRQQGRVGKDTLRHPLPELPVQDLHALFRRVDGVGASNDDIVAALNKVADSQRRQSNSDVSSERESLQLLLRALARRVRGVQQELADFASFLIARDVAVHEAEAVLGRCSAVFAVMTAAVMTEFDVRREAHVPSRGRAWVAMQSPRRRMFPREEFDLHRELSALPFHSTAEELHQRVLAITTSTPLLAADAPDTIAAGFAELRRISAMTAALASDLRTVGAQATARDEASVQRYRQAVDAMSAARLVVKDDEEDNTTL